MIRYGLPPTPPPPPQVRSRTQGHQQQKSRAWIRSCLAPALATMAVRNKPPPIPLLGFDPAVSNDLPLCSGGRLNICYLKFYKKSSGKHLLSALPNPQKQVSSRQSAPRAHEDHWLVDRLSLFVPPPAFSGRTGFPGLFLCDNSLRTFLPCNGTAQTRGKRDGWWLPKWQRGNPALSAERRPPRGRAAAPQRSQALLCFMPTQLSFFFCSLSLYCFHPYWVECNTVLTRTIQLSVDPTDEGLAFSSFKCTPRGFPRSLAPLTDWLWVQGLLRPLLRGDWIIH